MITLSQLFAKEDSVIELTLADIELTEDFQLSVYETPIAGILPEDHMESWRFATENGVSYLVVGTKSEYLVIRRVTDLTRKHPVCTTSSFDRVFGRVRSSEFAIKLENEGYCYAGKLGGAYEGDQTDLGMHYEKDFQAMAYRLSTKNFFAARKAFDAITG